MADFDIRQQSSEKEQDNALRPLCFADFAGQTKVTSNLKIFVEAAKLRGESLDHVLLFGPPGLGKTTLSNIIANELGVGFKVTSGPVLDKPGNLAGLLTSLEKNDVLVCPAKALRFMPNEALLKKGETISDVDSPTKVWTREGSTFTAHKVETGTTNGMLTEIVSGISEGTEVLIDFTITGGDDKADDQQAQNPFMPRPRGNNKQQNQQQKK